jgi:predicted esterase
VHPSLLIIHSPVFILPPPAKLLFLRIMNRIYIGVFLFILAAPMYGASIPDTISITSWLTVGPFSTAPRENAIDYLVEHGGEADIRPAEGMEHTSILAPGARVIWKRTLADSTGSVPLRYDSISWDTLAQYYGTAGMMTTSYAYAEFESPVEGTALALADAVSSFRLNGVSWPGDAYRQHFVRIPVPVRKGTNRLLVKQSGFTGGSFIFRLLPAPADIITIDRDATVPDAIEGELLSSPAGITLVNASEQPLGPISIHLESPSVLAYDTTITRMVALSILKIPVMLRSSERITRGGGDSLSIPLSIRWSGGTTTSTLRLRVRTAAQPRRVTFLSSMDGSAQYYGVNPALQTKSGGKPGLLLSLHGASVEAQGQAEAYQQKDWAYVVAPTNRRPFGFDWQDWGAQDALEVLADARHRFVIDTNRIWLTGHSMGGHGTWSVGLHHPDLFAAIAPSAGWTSFPLYIPWTLQRSPVYASPNVLSVRDEALRHDDLLLFTENASHLPAFILHGGSDDNVPAIQGRMFADALRRNGDSVVYKEVPDMGHWWDDPKTPGTDCIDDAGLLSFLRGHERNGWPEHIHFRTVDLGQSSGANWLTITGVENPFHDAIIDATITGTMSYNVTVENVTEFAIRSRPNSSDVPAEYAVRVNGTVIPCKPDTSGLLRFVVGADGFISGTRLHSELQKTPQCFGPMKQATFTPFVLVYGTTGDSASTAMLLHKARVQAQLWWRVGNGTVPVIADTEVTKQLFATKNLFLFGGPSLNRITARIAPRLPIGLDAAGARIEASMIRGEHLAAQFIYPNPEHPLRFVLIYEGSDAAGEQIAGAFNLFGSGSALPDYILYDASIRTKGWGGVTAAGFFDGRWQVSH